MNDFLDFEAFDDSELVPPSNELPRGNYTAALLEAGVNERENGTQIVTQWGEFATLDGEDSTIDPVSGGRVNFGKRRMFQREWITHTNEVAQRIGRQRLTQLGKAIGITENTDGKNRLPGVANGEELAELISSMAGARVKLFINKKPRRDDPDTIDTIVGSVSAL